MKLRFSFVIDEFLVADCEFDCWEQFCESLFDSKGFSRPEGALVVGEA